MPEEIPTTRAAVTPADRFAIQDLLTEFCWLADHGQAESVAGLFLPEGVIATPMFRLEGREQIAAHFRKRDGGGTVVSRHQWSNLRLTPLANGDVRAEVVVQCPSKLAQLLDAGVDVLDPAGEQFAHLSAGGRVVGAQPARGELLNVVERQTKRLRLLDEFHLVHDRVRVDTVAAMGPLRRTQQSTLFIVPKRLD